MTSTKRYLTVLLTSAAVLGAGVAGAQSAAPATAPAAAPQGQPTAVHKLHDGKRGEHHRGHRGHHAKGHHRGGHGMMLRGVKLSDAQKDQIFKIHHAQMPAVRDQMKIIRANRTELRKLSFASNFDAAKARELAGAEAQARATLAMMHAETQHKIFAVLTPEQRQQVQKRQEQRAQRGAERKPA